MAVITKHARKRAPILILLALAPAALTGCALPSASDAQGTRLLLSPACHCRFSYPAAWYFAPSNGDYSVPMLGVYSYDNASADHAPIPATFAVIGIDWQSDPIGQLYLAATMHRYSPWPARHLSVSGWAATSYSYWTAPPSRGGFYEQQIYLFVPWYQRDYVVWLQAAHPPRRDVSAQQRVFAQLLRSLTIVPPNAVP